MAKRRNKRSSTEADLDSTISNSNKRRKLSSYHQTSNNNYNISKSQSRSPRSSQINQTTPDIDIQEKENIPQQQHQPQQPKQHPPPSNPNEDSKDEDGDDFDDFDDFGEDFDEDFNDNQEDDDWDDTELNYDEQNVKTLDKNSMTAQQLFDLKMEKRRRANADKSKFWRCGKTGCEFLNHPSRGTCMVCNMPQMDVIRHCLNCEEPLKQCVKCNAYIVPKDLDDHELDCNPLCNDKKAGDDPKRVWYVDLTKAEKKAIVYVTNSSFKKSEKDHEKRKLLDTIRNINIENELIFGGEEDQAEILKKTLSFLEWKVPMIIHVHCGQLIPKLLDDTHYRNLFETGYGSGNTDQNIRKREEAKMFAEVYFGCDGKERPKYGI